MVFNNFVGNEKTKEHISGLFDSKRFPHVILINGEDGLGKRTLAREIATALVCKNQNAEVPCYNCTQCIKAQKKEHPDIYEYSPSGAPRSFHIEKVREIINDIYMPPNEAEYKIYILGNIHCMNESAQNAALKIFEEPPQYVIFILTAKSKSLLLPTILSRTTTFNVLPVEPEKAAVYISDRYDDISYDKAFNAVKAEHGNMGRALSNLLDAKAANYADFVKKAINAMLNNDEYAFMAEINNFGDRTEILSILQLLKTAIRDAMFDKMSNEKIAQELASSSKQLSKNLKKEELMLLSETVDDLIAKADKNANISLLETEISLSLFRAIDR